MYIEHANVLYYGPGKGEYFSKVNLIPIINSGVTLSKLLLDHSGLQFKKIAACLIHIGPFSLLLLSRSMRYPFFLYLKIDILKISFLQTKKKCHKSQSFQFYPSYRKRTVSLFSTPVV